MTAAGRLRNRRLESKRAATTKDCSPEVTALENRAPAVAGHHPRLIPPKLEDTNRLITRAWVRVMRKFLLGTAALVALASPAMSADMRSRPAYKAPPPVVPVWSWTGCYVGGHVGGLWATKHWTNVTPGSSTFGQSAGSHDVDRWLWGVQAGCDYQFAGGFVIGVASDYAWVDAEGSNVVLFDPSTTIKSKIDSLASITGRIGYAWERLLGYVKGGGAWEQDNFALLTTATLSTLGSVSTTRSGWTVGIGGEYAFANLLSGFIEYNYYDFGSRNHTFIVPGEPVIADIKETKSVLKAGLNLRFGGWGKTPVAAKY
jgi:outer membrane immunogenic protein